MRSICARGENVIRNIANTKWNTSVLTRLMHKRGNSRGSELQNGIEIIKPEHCDPCGNDMPQSQNNYEAKRLVPVSATGKAMPLSIRAFMDGSGASAARRERANIAAKSVIAIIGPMLITNIAEWPKTSCASVNNATTPMMWRTACSPGWPALRRRSGKLFALLIIACAFPAAAQISFVGQCSGTTSCTPPAHAVGDLFIAYAGRDATTTASTNPAAWTSVTTQSINGTSTADSVIRLSCKVATTTSETATGFTSAGSLVVLIYRGQAAGNTATCASIMVGTFSLSTINTTTTTVTFPARTNTDASSWDAGFVYAPAATAGIGTAPTGMQNRASSGNISAGDDTNGATSAFSSANITITTASRVISATIEIKAATVATPSGAPNGGSTTATSTSVTLSSSTVGAAICYTIDGTTPTAAAGSCTAGLTYSSPFRVTSDCNVKAIASKSGMVNSAVSTSNAFFILGVGLRKLPMMGLAGAESAVPAFVQGQAKQCTSCTTNNTVLFASNTAGNRLVVAVIGCGSASVSSISDTYSDNFGTQDYTHLTASGGCNAFFFHTAAGITGGANNTITVTMNTSNSFLTVLAAEFSGTSGTYDGDGATASGTSTSPAVSVSPTTTKQIIFGYSGGSADNTAVTPYAVAAVPSPTTGDVLIYYVSALSGAQSATFTQTSGAWDAIALSYR
jgi:hypothetical protein